MGVAVEHTWCCEMTATVIAEHHKTDLSNRGSYADNSARFKRPRVNNTVSIENKDSRCDSPDVGLLFAAA